MSTGQDAINAAISRGDKHAAALVAHRDALFPHLAALLVVTGGPDGLRASASGAVEAVIHAWKNRTHDWNMPDLGEGA